MINFVKYTLWKDMLKISLLWESDYNAPLYGKYRFRTIPLRIQEGCKLLREILVCLEAGKF